MHYYSHHIGDFIKDTANLNDHQLVTYLRLLWAYYTDEKPITGDLGRIAFAMRSDEKTIELILSHYFKNVDNCWHHGRCDREIAAYRSKKEKASLSAAKRWQNAKNDANAMRTHSECNANAPKNDANQEPITNNQVKDIHAYACKSALDKADPLSINGVPYKKLADLYLKHCPNMTKLRTTSWTDARKTVIRRAWIKKPDLEWWEGFFEYCGESKFLNGLTGDRRWKADLFWLIKPENFAKINEGKYHG